MREIPARLLPCLPADLAPEHLPTLPDWYPLDRPETEDREAVIHTPETRAQARRAAAISEACSGPFDGTSITVMSDRDGAPPATITVADVWAYRLSDRESTPQRCVYRYSPKDSPNHATTMRESVELPLLEYGRQHIMAAQHQAPEHDGINVERMTP